MYCNHICCGKCSDKSDISNCPTFINAMDIAKDILEKMKSDKDFKRFCEITNANMKNLGFGVIGMNYSKLEILLSLYMNR